MAMTARLWSISALAVELDMDRRTVAAKLRHVPPAGKLGKHDAWRLTDVLPVLVGRQVSRPSPRVAAPPGFTALERVHDRFEAGCLLSYLIILYRAPVLAAWAVVESGGTMTAAFEAARSLPMMLMIEMEKEAREAGLSWAVEAGEEAPALYNPDAFLPVDWHRLREKAGEPDWTPPMAIPGWRHEQQMEAAPT